MKNLNKVIHDIRNPLNTISANAELGKLLLENDGEIKNAIKAFEKIILECDNCAKAINQLSNSK